MESESGTNNTKISDSGYSNSCSNTTSQGSASSKSRHSGGSNSSRSNGYGGAPNQNESSESDHVQSPKRNKDREHKNKKQKVLAEKFPSVATIPQAFTVPTETFSEAPSALKPPMGVEPVPSPSVLEVAVPENLEAGMKNTEPLLTTVVPLVQTDIETIPIHVEEEDKSQIWTDKDQKEKSAENECDKELVESDQMPSSQPEANDGFCCVISMYDGVILYTTPSLTPALGFPKDMWLGHSFVDFIHPKDRETFSSQVSTCIAAPLLDSQGKVKDVRNYLHVCLRRHSNVNSSGVNVVDKPVSYQAFHLTVTIKQMTDGPETHLCDHNNGLFLVIFAVPVYSAYKVPGERKKSTKFGMRQTATCIFSYVDPDVVTNFGFLPQDMLGKSVFDFYHPEDMPFLKEVYKSVMKTCQINGSVFRSKPYRFLVQNGCFAMIETEWSSVVNPWSRRIEFVISLHQVLQGPLNPNVFDVVSDQEYKNIPEGVVKQGKVLQAEIIQFLTEDLPKPPVISSLDISKRCKDLAKFMESLMSTSKLEIDVAPELNRSISERDSVMLAEISPHHDFSDSKSSSETPPSYTQLNYNENITRFFQSNPKTTITSDESNSANNAVDTDGKTIQDCPPCAPNNQKCLSPIQNSGASGCGSAENLSSGSNVNLESGTSGTNTSNEDYTPHHLTESVLVRHNEDMEKIMILKHKKERSHIKDRETKNSHQKLKKYANEMLKEDTNENNNQGVKRSGSNLWEDDCHKLSKFNHQNGPAQRTGDNALNKKNVNAQKTLVTSNIQDPLPNVYRRENSFQSANEVNMWPSFSTVMAPNQQNPVPSFTPNNPYNPGMLPVYYVPALVQPRPILNNMEPSQRYQVQYMPANLLCNPIFLPQPILCPTVPIVPVPVQNPSDPINPDRRHFGNHVNPEVISDPQGPKGSGSSGNGALPQSNQYQFGHNAPNGSGSLPQCDRPSSQATSVKAQPGSRIGSIASASVVNKAINARNSLKLPGNNYRVNCMDEESSCYSSSYSSLLKTDTGSGSNDDSTSNNNTNRTDDELLKQQRKTYPMRKKDSPWVESVSVSSDLIYRYQLEVKDMEEILKSDLNTLKRTEQPMMVNDQLHQLYLEMELEGLSKALILEEGFSSSNSEEKPADNSNSNDPQQKRSFSSLMMTYEEDAPLPSPEANY